MYRNRGNFCIRASLGLRSSSSRHSLSRSSTESAADHFFSRAQRGCPHLSSRSPFSWTEALRAVLRRSFSSYFRLVSAGGLIGWIVPSEIVHSSLRARVISAGTLNWFADYLVISTFLSLRRELGESGVFCFRGHQHARRRVRLPMCPRNEGAKLDLLG